jgi:Rad52/22 family double-strand break repair protein
VTTTTTRGADSTAVMEPTADASDAGVSAEGGDSLTDAEGRPTPRGWRKIGELLRKPIPAKQRKGPGGRTLAYITARDVQNRLDAVVGPGNWSTRFRVLGRDPWVIECTLTVCGSSRADVGYSNAPDAEDEAEPAKAAYSDALKRAAVGFGIGRWLYAN